MNGTVIRFGKGGRVRAIHHDDYVLPGGRTRRASHVEPIPSGPNAGLWYVDMSPLGPQYQYCLWPPFETRREALDAETSHLEEVWIHGDFDKRT